MSKKFHIFTVVILILNTFELSKAGGGGGHDAKFKGSILRGGDPGSIVLGLVNLGFDIWSHMREMEVLGSIEEKTEALQKIMNQVNSKLENVQNDIGDIKDIIENLPDKIILYQLLRELQNYMIDLNALYGNYETFSKDISRYPTHTLDAFANRVLFGTEGLVERIRAVIMPSKFVGGDKGIIRLVADSLQAFTPSQQCNLNQSVHQVVYNLYNHIPYSMMRAFSMSVFSYCLLTLHGQGNYTDEILVLSGKYYGDIKEDLKLVREVLQPLSQDIWKCDPTVHVEGQTYLQVTRLLQEYVQNLVDLNNRSTCSGSCGSLDRTTKSYSCSEKLCRNQRKCEGNVINCFTLSWDSAQVCLAEPYSRSRYQYIDRHAKHENHTHCPDSPNILFLKKFVHQKHQCEYCFCYCDDKGDHLDRYFNMRPVMADIKNNRVITGLRFVNKNSIFHLQIQEAKLLPRGSIDESTVTWVPVEDYKINDTNVTSGRDYHVLSWEQPRIDLNDVFTDKGQVLTGIRLTEDEKESFLRLQITGTTFDLSSGLLDTTGKDPHWVSSKVSTTELKLENPKLSILSPSPSVPDSTSDSYMKFTHIAGKYIAQDTVPFLDAQRVESLAPGPLGGAGLYHKGLKGYGGFIAPKIITYDFMSNYE